MTIKTLAAAALAAGLAAAAVGPVAAQTSPSPAAVSNQPYQLGPALPGICSISVGYVMQNSQVGKFVSTRMQQLASEVKAELSAEQSAIDTDAKTLEGQRASLSNDQLQQRAAALQERERDLQRKADQRQRELQDTYQGATNTALSYADPIVHSLVASHNCSMLLNGDQAVVAIQASMDLSSSVVQQLDAKVTQFPFEREHLDAQGGAAGAGASPAQ